MAQTCSTGITKAKKLIELWNRSSSFLISFQNFIATETALQGCVAALDAAVDAKEFQDMGDSDLEGTIGVINDCILARRKRLESGWEQATPVVHGIDIVGTCSLEPPQYGE